MSDETAYSKARKLFEEIDIGGKISAQELANKVGATNYEDRKKVAAFLSQQAAKGRVKKSMGKDKRMYYEKHAPPPKSPPSKVAPVRERSKETITLGEIGESIVNYIEGLEQRLEQLEKERDRLREKASIFSQQKEDFKRLYQEAEGKIKELSGKQPVALRTVRLSRVVGD